MIRQHNIGNVNFISVHYAKCFVRQYPYELFKFMHKDSKSDIPKSEWNHLEKYIPDDPENFINTFIELKSLKVFHVEKTPRLHVTAPMLKQSKEESKISSATVFRNMFKNKDNICRKRAFPGNTGSQPTRADASKRSNINKNGIGGQTDKPPPNTNQQKPPPNTNQPNHEPMDTEDFNFNFGSFNDNTNSTPTSNAGFKATVGNPSQKINTPTTFDFGSAFETPADKTSNETAPIDVTTPAPAEKSSNKTAPMEGIEKSSEETSNVSSDVPSNHMETDSSEADDMFSEWLDYDDERWTDMFIPPTKFKLIDHVANSKPDDKQAFAPIYKKYVKDYRFRPVELLPIGEHAYAIATDQYMKGSNREPSEITGYKDLLDTHASEILTIREHIYMRDYEKAYSLSLSLNDKRLTDFIGFHIPSKYNEIAKGIPKIDLIDQRMIDRFHKIFYYAFIPYTNPPNLEFSLKFVNENKEVRQDEYHYSLYLLDYFLLEVFKMYNMLCLSGKNFTKTPLQEAFANRLNYSYSWNYKNKLYGDVAGNEVPYKPSGSAVGKAWLFKGNYFCLSFKKSDSYPSNILSKIPVIVGLWKQLTITPKEDSDFQYLVKNGFLLSDVI